MDDLISRQAAIDAVKAYWKKVVDDIPKGVGFEELTQLCNMALEHNANILKAIDQLPSAQPDIKQAAKLLSDFIESCPGGDSYLITPDGEKLRTDWGYATEGIQLIHDWAERRSDG